MTGKLKDWITKIIITVVAGAMVSLFTFYLARKAYSGDKIQEEINKKLDKTEFKDFKNDHQLLHETEQGHYKEVIDRIDKRLDDIYKYVEAKTEKRK